MIILKPSQKPRYQVKDTSPLRELTLEKSSLKPQLKSKETLSSQNLGELFPAEIILETNGGWINHVYRLNQVIQKMTKRGLPIDKAALDTLGLELDNEKLRLAREIKELLSKREAEKGTTFWGYKTEDNYLVLPKVLREECKLRGSEVTEVKRRKNKETGKFEKVEVTEIVPLAYCHEDYKYPCPMDKYEKWFVEFAVEAGFEFVTQEIPLDPDTQDAEEVSCLVAKESFNPASPAQLKDYCYWMNYSIPLSIKKTSKGREEKESTDDKALEELLESTKDSMFSLIQSFREVGKLKSTYVVGWQPNGKDGRLHSEFTFTPATGQLSSRNPNVQNAPSGGNGFGKQFKKVVKARPGRVILNVDWSGFHAQLTGYFAESPEFMRLSLMGVHDYLAAYMLERQIAKMKPKELETDLWQETIAHISDIPQWLSYSDDVLRSKLKWIKTNHSELRNKKAKPAVHGINFMLGAKKLYEMNKKSFSGQKEAKEIIQLFFTLFPQIKKFQEKIVEKAYQDKKLVSPYGFVRRFFEAKIWDTRNRDMKNGEDAEKAAAFLAASTAFSIKKECMLRLEAMGANEKYWLFNEVHDSLMFEPLEEELDEAVKLIYSEIVRPIKKLAHPVMCPDGLVCAAEVAAGPTWAEIKEIKL